MAADDPTPTSGHAAAAVPGSAPSESAAVPSGTSRGWSVRTRLTVLTSALLCLALTAGAVALAAVLARERTGSLDDLLRERLAVVTGLVEEDRVPRVLPAAQPGEVAQVLDADGRVVASSASASRTLPVVDVPDLPEAVREGGPGGGSDGASDEPGASGTAGSSDGASDASDGSDSAPDAPDADRRAVHLRTLATPYDAQARVAIGTATHRGAPVHVVVTVPFTEVQGAVRALAVALVGVVPLLTALLAWAIWSVLGRALRPVEEMRRAAAQVAREGGPGSLPVPRADDELAALARTLNEMLDRLEGSAARQRTFVADAAHELRSPLAALRAQVDVARAHPDAFTAAELAADVEPEVHRVQRLVDDLLLLARVGSRPLTDADVDLRALAEEALDVVRGADLVPDGVVVEVTGTGHGRGDATALVRVVRNLLENATRHARTTVRVDVADGRVTVDDDGPGVPPADRERVFERFVRLDDARDRGGGGSGLGLPIAREVARESGGDVALGDAPLGGLRAVLTTRS